MTNTRDGNSATPKGAERRFPAKFAYKPRSWMAAWLLPLLCAFLAAGAGENPFSASEPVREQPWQGYWEGHIAVKLPDGKMAPPIECRLFLMQDAHGILGVIQVMAPDTDLLRLAQLDWGRKDEDGDDILAARFAFRMAGARGMTQHTSDYDGWIDGDGDWVGSFTLDTGQSGRFAFSKKPGYLLMRCLMCGGTGADPFTLDLATYPGNPFGLPAGVPLPCSLCFTGVYCLSPELQAQARADAELRRMFPNPVGPTGGGGAARPESCRTCLGAGSCVTCNGSGRNRNMGQDLPCSACNETAKCWSCRGTGLR